MMFVRAPVIPKAMPHHRMAEAFFHGAWVELGEADWSGTAQDAKFDTRQKQRQCSIFRKRVTTFSTYH